MNDMIFSSLKRFRLPAMAAEYRRQEELPASTSLTFDERMLMMTQAEEDARHDKRVARLLRKATLRDSKAALENLDYRPERKLEKSQVARLADCRWIHDGRNMLLTGPCGTGKTYLASAFGRAACRLGYEVKAVRASRLFVDLQIGRGDGSWEKILDILKKPDLLILDDFGLTPLEPLVCRDLLEVVDERHGVHSTLLASQIPVSSWYHLFGDKTIAEGILDRLLSGAERFELSGASLRRGEYAGEAPAEGGEREQEKK